MLQSGLDGFTRISTSRKHKQNVIVRSESLAPFCRPCVHSTQQTSECYHPNRGFRTRFPAPWFALPRQSENCGFPRSLRPILGLDSASTHKFAPERDGPVTPRGHSHLSGNPSFDNPTPPFQTRLDFYEGGRRNGRSPIKYRLSAATNSKTPPQPIGL